MTIPVAPVGCVPSRVPFGVARTRSGPEVTATLSPMTNFALGAGVGGGTGEGAGAGGRGTGAGVGDGDITPAERVA